MARPTFKIDPNRLRSLRKESSLTQLQVAKKAHAILDKSTQTTDRTILSSYQRIERTGDTSNAMATALAKVFKTTVEILQGGAPELEDSLSVVNRIEQQLREQKNLGSNLAFQRALVQHVETYSGTTNEDDCIRDFAEDIGTQIEVAQIGQNASEIAQLAALTGWSAEQLQQPSGVHGHWLLLTTVHGSRKTEIVLGASFVMYRIREAVEKYMKWSQSDVRITLRRSLPWFHVDITDPCIPARRLKFSFVRCRPEVNGLKWVNPTWRDQFWLEEPLEDWAFSKVNLLSNFDGKNRPDDVRRLRFQVQERVPNGEFQDGFQRVAYSKGRLDELREEVFQNFKAEGNSHFIVINWLANGLARSLAPHLTAYPPECWEIRPGTCHIAILLNIPFKLLLANKELVYCNGNKYHINLVEETSPGIYQSAPWRDDSVADICSLLKKRVFEKCDELDHEDALQFLNLPVSSS